MHDTDPPPHVFFGLTPAETLHDMKRLLARPLLCGGTVVPFSPRRGCQRRVASEGPALILPFPHRAGDAAETQFREGA